MANEESFQLELCKLLLDEDRLTILGRLAQKALSAEELRTELGIKERELTRHLQQLHRAEMLITQTDGAIEKFSLDVSTLHRYKKQLFAAPTARHTQSETEKTLAAFVKAGVLTGLPVQHGKLLVILGWLAARIPPGVDHDERTINELLKGHEIDHVTLRRLLIDYGFMTRAAGIYRRNE